MEKKGSDVVFIVNAKGNETEEGFIESLIGNGDLYVGFCNRNRTEGVGKYVWSDGCLFQGLWSKGKVSEKGKITWPSGATYVGNFHGNCIHGYGSYTDRNGESYEGQLVMNQKHGYGRKRYSNGDVYEGLWRSGVLHGHGRYECRCGDNTVCFSERHGNLQAEVPIADHANDALVSELSVFQSGSPDDQKRLGEVICKGHGSYKLVRVLQRGIRYFSLKNMALPKQEPSTLDFRTTISTKIRCPSDTPRYSLNDFKWKDYCPAVFRHLQELHNIDTAGYMLSICGNETLRELTSPGKSGCLLYLSHDDRFVIKTMHKSEMKVLLEMLPNYYQHVRKYGNTLLTKFYGLHVVKPFGGRKVHFVVMGNIFCSELRIHKRFDLKGSSQGRCVSKVEIDESTTFKDLDLNYAFYLDSPMRNQLLTQIKHDCNFLEAEGIMDYSLLLGVHMPSTSSSSCHGKGSVNGGILTRNTSFPGNSFQFHVPTHRGDDLPLSCTKGADNMLGVKMPAHAVRVNKIGSGSVSSHCRVAAKEDYNVLLYIGIIDILQDYNMVKRMEHVYKSLQFDSQSISAVDPKSYSTRFQYFLCNVFPAKGLDF